MPLNTSFDNTVYPIPSTAGEKGWSSLTNFLVALANKTQVKTKQIASFRSVATADVVINPVSDFLISMTLLGARTVSLPNNPSSSSSGLTVGQIFAVVDGSGSAGVAGQSVSINQTVTPCVINSNYGGVILQWTGTVLVVIAEFKGSSPTFSSVKITSLASGFLKVNSATGLISSVSSIVDADITSIAGTKVTYPPSANITSTNVSAAILELDTRLRLETTAGIDSLVSHIGNPTTHGISLLAYTSTALAATISNGSIVSFSVSAQRVKGFVTLHGRVTYTALVMGTIDLNLPTTISVGEIAVGTSVDIRSDGLAITNFAKFNKSTNRLQLPIGGFMGTNEVNFNATYRETV